MQAENQDPAVDEKAQDFEELTSDPNFEKRKNSGASNGPRHSKTANNAAEDEMSALEKEMT